MPLHICLVERGVLPVNAYGGTERVVWYLARELSRDGHRVTLLAGRGSRCDFARVLPFDPEAPLTPQLPTDCDLIHFHFPPEEAIELPHIVTNHGNRNDLRPFPLNTVFLSANHAARYGAQHFVYNGLDWDDYGKVPLEKPADAYAHFLGNAAWRVKNVQGAIRVARMAGKRLVVMGGKRLNLKMGFRFTADPRVRFAGMVGGEKKLSLLRNSAALVFPVRWHEPFGLAVIESLYFGCPVFATPYGAIPELVDQESGLLSNRADELAAGLRNASDFDRRHCHQRAVDVFNARRMMLDYVRLYEAVLDGAALNTSAPVLQVQQQDKFLPWYG